ncbi:hypothetical protein [Dyadobacter sp. 32]|uniref:hypothetical protein n=1 Tax=Dyadobacter sp. 32 TaxID=538966 RepID=UPI0011EBB63A
MKTPLFTILVCISFVSSAQVATTTPVDSTVFDKNLKQFSDKIITLQVENQKTTETLTTLTKKLDETRSKLQNTPQNRELLTYVSGKIDSLSKSQEKNEEAKLKVNCEAGSTILKQMQNGLNIITFMQILVALQDTVQQLYSPWDYKPIRNSWKRADNFATIAGSIVSVSSLFFKNQDSKNATLASGVSVIGLMKLIGVVSNQDKKQEDQLNNLMAQADSNRVFLNMSMNAYDELVRINFKLRGYISQNKKLKSSIDAFAPTYKCEDTPTKIKTNVNALKDFIADYEATLKQIPEYLAEIKSFQKSMAYKYPQFRDRTKGIIVAATNAEDFFTLNVYPILKVDTNKLLSQ